MEFALSPRFSDVTLIARDGIKVPAHRVLLAMTCDLFNAGDNFQESNTFMVDCTGECLKRVINFLYGSITNTGYVEKINYVDDGEGEYFYRLEYEAEKEESDNDDEEVRKFREERKSNKEEYDRLGLQCPPKERDPVEQEMYRLRFEENDHSKYHYDLEMLRVLVYFLARDEILNESAPTINNDNDATELYHFVTSDTFPKDDRWKGMKTKIFLKLVSKKWIHIFEQFVLEENVLWFSEWKDVDFRHIEDIINMKKIDYATKLRIVLELMTNNSIFLGYKVGKGMEGNCFDKLFPEGSNLPLNEIKVLPPVIRDNVLMMLNLQSQLLTRVANLDDIFSEEALAYLSPLCFRGLMDAFIILLIDSPEMVAKYQDRIFPLFVDYIPEGIFHEYGNKLVMVEQTYRIGGNLIVTYHNGHSRISGTIKIKDGKYVGHNISGKSFSRW